MGKFLWVNLNSTNKQERILMEEGTQFENNSCKYTMTSKGLSIFDKSTETTKIGDTIELRDYQYQVLNAVIDNSDDGKKVKTLSNKDIKLALNMHKNKTLATDLSTNLKGNYEVENPRRFSNENKISAYITNGRKSTSAVLCFQYDVDKINKNTIKIDDDDLELNNKTPKTIQNTSSSFTGKNLFKHHSIIEKKPFTYTVKAGDDLVSIARKYEIDTYQLIAANPQLKINKDYTVIFPKNDLAKLNSNLKAGTKITIPARYGVKKGSCKNLTDVANITGVSKNYLYDFLTVVEPKIPRQPDLVTYLDDGGTPTIGYGHTGRVDGKALSMKHPIHITEAEALEILAEDILKHKAMTMAYIGKDTYLKAPNSVQNTILDIAYNKGIWDGYLTNRGYADSTSKVKSDLEKGHYASALVHSRREKTGFRGIRKRNIYRFISGLKDLTPKQRKAAMDGMEAYYKQELARCRKSEKPKLQSAWENAKKGITTGYVIF